MARATSATEPVAGETPVASPRQQSHAWADAPLRAKVTVLVLLAAVGGALVGMIEARFNHTVWPLAVGLLLLCVGLIRLGSEWVWRPIERLVGHLGRLSQEQRSQPIKTLPVNRNDEVGQLARVIHEMSTWLARAQWDAMQLRRTFEDQLAKATRARTRHMEQIAMRDALTGLENRRFIEENLEPLTQTCRDAGEELICMAIDMDNFKQVNDSRGHAKGDLLLREFANILRANIRRGDFGVRLGGDEFVVFLPGCPVHRAKNLAERLIALFRQWVRTEYASDLAVSVSIGIASLKHDDPASGADLLIKADQALYAAKRSGKNCSSLTDSSAAALRASAQTESAPVDPPSAG